MLKGRSTTLPSVAPMECRCKRVRDHPGCARVVSYGTLAAKPRMKSWFASLLCPYACQRT